MVAFPLLSMMKNTPKNGATPSNSSPMDASPIFYPPTTAKAQIYETSCRWLSVALPKALHFLQAVINDDGLELRGSLFQCFCYSLHRIGQPFAALHALSTEHLPVLLLSNLRVASCIPSGSFTIRF